MINYDDFALFVSRETYFKIMKSGGKQQIQILKNWTLGDLQHCCTVTGAWCLCLRTGTWWSPPSRLRRQGIAIECMYVYCICLQCIVRTKGHISGYVMQIMFFSLCILWAIGFTICSVRIK